MTLEEFDKVVDRMKLALESAENLGQFTDAVQVLFQMNSQLPEDMQINFEELTSPDEAKSFVSENKSKLQFEISEYRQMLMINS